MKLVTRFISTSIVTRICVLLTVTVSGMTSASDQAEQLSNAAERYVHLGLELGQYDANYVDAYLGPKEWQKAAAKPRSKEKLAADIAALKSELASISFDDPALSIRHKSLSRNVRAMDTRIRMVNGETFSFAEEALLIYDVVLPKFDFAEFDQALSKIDALLPGDGDLAGRVDKFRSTFDVAPERLEKLFDASIAECRTRSKKHIAMPETESFTLEYVSDKSWTGYNWYQGNNHSLMQLNQDFPTKIDSAIRLGCHEGYPGHHVWNVLIEEELIKGKGWVEFNLYPLFSPYGVIAEGSAEYGVSLAFPEDEKIQYEKDVLYPLAGLDSKNAAKLAQLKDLVSALSYARIAIAQAYLDGEIDREEAIKQIVKYSLVSEKRAESSVKFIEQYRAYVLNYSYGEKVIADYVERNSETAEQRWAVFKQLLTQLSTASDLIEGQ